MLDIYSRYHNQNSRNRSKSQRAHNLSGSQTTYTRSNSQSLRELDSYQTANQPSTSQNIYPICRQRTDDHNSKQCISSSGRASRSRSVCSQRTRGLSYSGSTYSASSRETALVISYKDGVGSPSNIAGASGLRFSQIAYSAGYSLETSSSSSHLNYSSD